MSPDTTPARHRAPTWPDRAIAELAARQRTLVTTRQLRALGVTARMVGNGRRRGRLHRVHRGVYSLVLAAARPPLAAEQAALLATGPAAALSHWSAAPVHGLHLGTRPPDVIHLTAGPAHLRGHPGFTVHRTRALHPGEAFRTHGLRTTSVARTVVDLAPLVDDLTLGRLVDQALRLTSRAKLLEAVDRHAGRPGVSRLRRLLDPARPSADTWSRAEARLLTLIRRAGLPIPEANVAVGAYVADLVWRAARVIVEYDSRWIHDRPGAFDADRGRDNDLEVLGGWEVVHVTDHHLLHQPERVLVWITVALNRRGAV